MPRRAALLVCLLFLVSCSVAPSMPDPPSSHPASPDAEEAPMPPRSATLIQPAGEPREAERADTSHGEDK